MSLVLALFLDETRLGEYDNVPVTERCSERELELEE